MLTLDDKSSFVSIKFMYVRQAQLDSFASSWHGNYQKDIWEKISYKILVPYLQFEFYKVNHTAWFTSS